ncbi:MAG: hypothetical protein FD123_2064 [Bacteroidetes bacterium]|nr:MAG: hypothetical protein FD123_2064 [Bacteroidota bacterium]
MKTFFFLFLNVLIIGLFLFSKLLPYKDKLGKQYAGIFRFFQAIFDPVLNFMRKLFKPAQVGQGLAVDMAQIILLVLLLILLNFCR